MPVSTPPDEDAGKIVVELAPRRGWFRRRSNRRVPVTRVSITVMLLEGLRTLGHKLVVLGKVVVVLAFVAGAVLAGRRLVQQVIASPRFAVREVRVGATVHATEEEIRDLSGVHEGDRLLAIDPDTVAAALATHPWVASARVRRELPSVLSIEVVEKSAVANALIGALYLLDESGRPFKRATLAESDGLPVITGVTREQYAAMRSTSEAVFREALSVIAAYGTDRPKLSEVHVDPRTGFSLVMLEGGGEIRLGRGQWEEKLTRLDKILGALDARGPAALTTVYLDGPLSDRVTVRLAQARHEADEAPPPAAPTRKRRTTVQ